MKRENKLELRMYGLVNYQLTGIQQGIQFGHSVVEYGQKFKNDEIYNEWANNHKTFIILNGGTTNDKLSMSGLPFGTLNNHLITLLNIDINFSAFYEPDLGDQLTSFVFIVDERVFNKKLYPDYEDWLVLNEESIMLDPNILEESELKEKWTNLIGGEKNEKLRDFLKDFRLA